MEEQDDSLAHGALSCRNSHRGDSLALRCPIEGMESVVATVSGYHGSERFNLIKMISYTGASYVGVMSRSITHLICWKLEGRKFNLAKKFKTIIVNHCWLEDCIKQRKRVPEGPYILQSGQSAGPLSMDLLLTVKGSVSTKKYHELSEKLHICGNVEEQSIKSICSFGDSIWPRSCLLNKDLFSDFEESDDNSRKSKHKLCKKISNQEGTSNSRSRNHFQEPTLSGLFAIEYGSSSSLARDERKGKNANQSPTVKSSRRRRLVRMNTNEDHNEPNVWNFDPECYHSGPRSRGNSFAVSSSHLENETDIEVVDIGGTPDRDQLCDQRGLARDSFEGVEACENQSTSNCSNLPVENAPRVMRTSEDELSDFDALQKKNEDPALELNASLPTSTELSCVICWTDFSSTRGVLPCGHRFCYSCIQNWADRMASSRKISTCPLCKASFQSITKVEDAATSDQKIYSQTIPCGPSLLDVFILPDQETLNSSAQPSVAAVCSACRCREPEDLLMSCHLCQIRHIHSYCLDPPLLPWTCIHCKDLQTLYHRIH